MMHVFSPLPFAISLRFGCLMFAGLVNVIKQKKTIAFEVYFIPLFIIGILILDTPIPLLSLLNSAIRSTLPLFDETFRFPFTKFSLDYILAFAVFFVQETELITKHILHYKNRQVMFFDNDSLDRRLCLFCFSEKFFIMNSISRFLPII